MSDVICFHVDAPTNIGVSEEALGVTWDSAQSVVILEDVPVYLRDVSVGDRLRVEQRDDMRFDIVDVVSRSGHMTIQADVNGALPGVQDGLRVLLEYLEGLGCRVATKNTGKIGIDVPLGADASLVASIAYETAVEGAWTYAFSNSGIAAARGVRMAMFDGAEPASWWWLSFCDPGKPDGEAFLGVSIVEGLDVVSAAERARHLGINPGGEVVGKALPESEIPPPQYRNRLLQRHEVEESGMV